VYTKVTISSSNLSIYNLPNFAMEKQITLSVSAIAAIVEGAIIGLALCAYGLYLLCGNKRSGGYR
jgi:hypothetical protein